MPNAAEDPLAYEEWAKRHFQEPKEYSDLNMKEFKSYMANGYTMVYPDGRSRYSTTDDMRVFVQIRDTYTRFLDETEKLYIGQRTVIVASAMAPETIRSYAQQWRELYERSVKAFEELVKEYEKDTVLTYEEWNFSAAFSDSLLCEVEFKHALTGLPLLTAPAPLHLAALMQFGRSGESSDPYMTALDLVTTAYILAT